MSEERLSQETLFRTAIRTVNESRLISAGVQLRPHVLPREPQPGFV